MQETNLFTKKQNMPILHAHPMSKLTVKIKTDKLGILQQENIAKM